MKPARTTMQREIAKDLAEIRDSECTPCVVGEHHCCVDARERHGDVRGVKIGNAVGLRGGTCFLLFRVNYKNDRGMPMAILFHLSITRDYPPPRTSCFSFFLFFFASNKNSCFPFFVQSEDSSIKDFFDIAILIRSEVSKGDFFSRRHFIPYGRKLISQLRFRILDSL